MIRVIQTHPLVHIKINSTWAVPTPSASVNTGLMYMYVYIHSALHGGFFMLDSFPFQLLQESKTSFQGVPQSARRAFKANNALRRNSY